MQANGIAEGKPTATMIDSLFGPHMANVQGALGKATERHAMLADNLANVNTPGFKRRDVDFNILLQEKMGPFDQRAKDAADQATQEASDRVSLRMDGNNVDMEHEVMGLAETQMRYEALTDIASDYFSGLKAVIKG